MTNKKSTKKALLMSALSLLLCMSMLVGTTFAWFTDSVSTTNNIITAGNLDVNLYWSTNGADWTPVDADTNIFKTETLWEPGHTEVVYFKVANEGTLALKYTLDVNVDSEIEGTNIAGESFKLSDYILYTVNDGVKTYADSAAARGDETGYKLNTPYNKTAQLLEKGEENVLTMVVFMPTIIGNEANYRGDAIPTIKMGINLLATQYTKEQDSYGPEYDENAWTDVAEAPVIDAEGTVNVWTAEQLAGVMANIKGVKTINIMEDINLIGRNWTPANFWDSENTALLTINGNGHTIFNMTANGAGKVGFIGSNSRNITINNLTFENAEVVSSSSFAGTVIAYAYGNITLNNVDVVNSNISVDSSKIAIRAGGLIGFIPSDGGSLTLTDCDVTGSVISGYHNVGAMVGSTMTSKPVSIENCSATENTLKYGSSNVGAFAFGASTSGYTEYVPATGFTAENNKLVAAVSGTATLNAALNAGKDAVLMDDVKVLATEVGSNGYGATGVTVSGSTLDGNGNSLGVDAWTTWDSAINITGGTIKNLKVNCGMRGIFMGSATADVYIDNVIIDGTIYTFNSDGGDKNYGVYISNSTLNGWTSHSDVHKEVVYTNCEFGEGQGYAYCRPYGPTKFIGCNFSEGFTVEPIGAVVFENCTINGVALTAENVADLVTNPANATVK